MCKSLVFFYWTTWFCLRCSTGDRMWDRRPPLSGPRCPHSVGPALWGHDQDCMLPMFLDNRCGLCHERLRILLPLLKKHITCSHTTLAVMYVYNQAMTDLRAGDVTIRAALGLDEVCVFCVTQCSKLIDLARRSQMSPFAIHLFTNQSYSLRVNGRCASAL